MLDSQRYEKTGQHVVSRHGSDHLHDALGVEVPAQLVHQGVGDIDVERHRIGEFQLDAFDGGVYR